MNRKKFVEAKFILHIPIVQIESWIEYSISNPYQFIILTIPKQSLVQQGQIGKNEFPKQISHFYFYFKPINLQTIIDKIRKKILELI